MTFSETSVYTLNVSAVDYLRGWFHCTPLKIVCGHWQHNSRCSWAMCWRATQLEHQIT